MPAPRAAISTVIRAPYSDIAFSAQRFESVDEIDFFQKYFCRRKTGKVFFGKSRSVHHDWISDTRIHREIAADATQFRPTQGSLSYSSRIEL